MERDTSIGGAADRFPPTRYSAVVAAKNPDAAVRERAVGTLIATYWKPVYKYIRVHWHASNEDAKDLTQAVFAAALEKAVFERFDASRGTFRNYLRLCVDGYVSNERKAARRAKRGGGVAALPLDFETAEGELRALQVTARDTPETFFEAEWTRALFALAVESLRERLKAEGKDLHFLLFERYDLDGDGEAARPTYEALAAAHDIPVTQVTNLLAAARRSFRSVLLERLREVTGSDDEFRDEARRLLGVDPAARSAR